MLASPDHLDLWRIYLNPQNVTVEDCLSALSEDEQKRGFGFVFLQNRTHYFIARFSMRMILSYYLDTKPSKIEFAYNEYGKPFLKNREIEFNLSHCNEQAILAVTHQSLLGIDIEYMNHELDLQPIAQEILSEREYQEFSSLDYPFQTRAFYRAWTCKEAFTKCLGYGLFFDVRCCQVNLNPFEKVDLLSIDCPGLNSQDYHIYDIRTNISDYIAVTVNKGGRKQLRYFDFSF